MILLGQYTTKEREEALEDAERRLDLKGHMPIVELPVKSVKTMPVLFQPREFIGGDKENNRATLDPDHVKSLKRAVEIHGDIEPPMVIKLKGTGFVIGDGHHTIEAYKAAKKTTIKCAWFNGTVREAMDYSMRRNGKDKLSLRQAERQQEGWKRTLLGGYTAPQIAKICGIGERQVRNMRQVIRAAEDDKRGHTFRERLKEFTKDCELDATPLDRLKTVSWQVAQAIRRNASPEEATAEEKAAALAVALRNKMERRLANEPHVTALALRIYDKNLPTRLMAEFAAMDMTADTASIEEARAAYEKRNKAASERGRRAARTRARQKAEGDVARAANAKLYAKEPEERRAAEERFKEAQETLKKFKAAQAAAEEQETHEEDTLALEAPQAAPAAKAVQAAAKDTGEAARGP
jgi:ParB-like chromosome segregation protein Spo0J